MFEQIILWYHCVVVLFCTVLVLDWVIGLDKLSTALDNTFTSYDSMKLFTSMLGTSILSVLFMVGYFSTGLVILKFGSWVLGTLVLGALIVMAICAGIYFLLLQVRKLCLKMWKKA